MLVLGRHPNERITLFIPGHEPIQIIVTEICHRQVRLGFLAPPEVKIYRNETLGRYPSGDGPQAEAAKEESGPAA